VDLIVAYKDLTNAIETATAFSRPMLHVHAGMAIYLMRQLFIGERRGSVVALSMVLLAELGNEVMNRLYWGSWRWDDTLADIVTRLFWPVLCLAVSWFGRWRWQLARSRVPHRTERNWPLPAAP
jgi:hypothetical protein